MAGLKELPETAEQRRVRNLLADDRAEHLIPPEALAQGDFADVTVVADDQSQATVKRNRITNPMLALYERGSITEEQFEASVEIARVAEIIAQAVGTRSASLEARVDNSGSAKDLLIEHIGRVRLEATYSEWRQTLPMPRRMVIDLVTGSVSLTVSSRRYRMRKRKAKVILVDALDRWIGLRSKIESEIEEQEVIAAHFRAGGGIIA
ncbi:MAG: hypothetical protein KA233_03045 [Novosphingobium sp.]|nr:hypothetical protein [Novosphingobium sp.]